MAERVLRENKVRYDESALFRVVIADGVHGGITPRGRLHFSFYNERGATPYRSTMRENLDGSASEINEQRDDDIVRQLEVNVTMELQAAMAFAPWLVNKMAELSRVTKVPDSVWNEFVANLNAAINSK